MHFSKSFMIHMKETCCPCLVKIHVNKLPVASWPCSLLIPYHINILAEDQCQACFHLTNPALLALFSLWSLPADVLMFVLMFFIISTGSFLPLQLLYPKVCHATCALARPFHKQNFIVECLFCFWYTQNLTERK